MHELIVPPPQNKSLVAQAVSLYQTFKDFEPGQPVSFNLSNLQWVCPSLLLPISAYIFTHKGSIATGENPAISSYLETVQFPGGVDSVSDFEAQVQEYKTYIPISVLKKNIGVERERLEALFGKMVNKVIMASPGA